jgi:hypothetical protein
MIDKVPIGPGSDSRDNGCTINELVDAVNSLLPVISHSGFVKLTNGPGGLVLDDSALIAAIRRAGLNI